MLADNFILLKNEGETISVREIQARLRSGESMETLAREADCSIDKIERFAGPIVQERAYIIGLAQHVVMRKESGREPVTFAEVVTIHLAPRQVEMSAVEWNTWRIEDGSWIIRVRYPNRDGMGVADQHAIGRERTAAYREQVERLQKRRIDREDTARRRLLRWRARLRSGGEVDGVQRLDRCDARL